MTSLVDLLRGDRMVEKFSRWFEKERPPKRVAAPRLSALQQSILHWLRNELRRRQRLGEADMVPYPDLVQGLGVEKILLTGEIRALLRKDLLSVTLPSGSWVRYVSLTDKGALQAKTLAGQQTHGRRRT